MRLEWNPISREFDLVGDSSTPIDPSTNIPTLYRWVHISLGSNLSIEADSGLRIAVGNSQISTVNKSISVKAGGMLEIFANSGLNVQGS